MSTLDWARVLHFVPTREAVALCATSQLLSEAVRLLLRRHVRSWRLVRTASDAAVFRSATARSALLCSGGGSMLEELHSHRFVGGVGGTSGAGGGDCFLLLGLGLSK